MLKLNVVFEETGKMTDTKKSFVNKNKENNPCLSLG